MKTATTNPATTETVTTKETTPTHPTKTKKLTKRDIILTAVCSFMFAFNLLMFNQLDILLHNENEFGIATGEVLWFLALVTLALTAVLTGLLLLLCRFQTLPYRILLGILFGYTLATYAQVLFFNGDSMNVMDGSATFTGVNQAGVVINAIIFLLLWFAPAVLLAVLWRKQNLLKKLVLGMCVIIIGMQSVGLITTAGNIKPLAANAKYYYFSIDETLQVSQGENIIVFVMDRMSTQYTDQVFDRYGDDATQIFNGFTQYRNNLSEYRQTFPSVAKTLTSYPFDHDQAQTEYLPNAWENNTVFKALKKHNYRVNGLFDSVSTYYNAQDMAPYFDNFKIATRDQTKIKYDQLLGFTTGIAAMRFAPFFVKDMVPNQDYGNLANQIVDLGDCAGYYPKISNGKTDLFYYDTIQKQPLTTTAQNSFSFVHLHSSHMPYTYDENLHKTTNGDPVAQTYGCMKILDTYFTQLKSLHDANGVNLFDKSTIIVMADHGSEEGGKNMAFASLFIKRAGESDALPLYINNTAQMSTRNFAPTIMELLGETKTDHSYFDLDPDPKSNTDTELTQSRYFYFLQSWAGWQGDIQSVATLDWSAEIIGNAYDDASWHYGKQYTYA